MNNSFNKKYKKLYKAYKKRFKTLSNNYLCNQTMLDYFIEYLKFTRDYLILTEQLVDENGIENLKITTLATAIEEYYAYRTCINKYYKISKNNVIQAINENELDIQQKYSAEKNFHWTYFCELVRTHIESWFTTDDSI